jgi:hypothetical protein
MMAADTDFRLAELLVCHWSVGGRGQDSVMLRSMSWSSAA